MKLSRKDYQFNIEHKEQDDKFLRISGIATPFDGKADLGGDVIEYGAYKRTLDHKGTKRVLLWHHNTKEPIGTADLEETREGLMLKEGLINKNVSKGNDVAELVGMDALKGLSIGYKAINPTYKNNKRHLKEIGLYELSVLPFGMNEGALITGAKGEDLETAEELNFMVGEFCQKAKDGNLSTGDIENLNKSIKSLNVLLLNRAEVDPKPLASSITPEQDEPDEKELKEIDELVFNFKSFLKEKIK